MNWFSGLYDALTQRRFNEAISEGYAEEAVRLLERLHPGRNLLEVLERTRTLLEGYRGVIEDARHRGWLKGEWIEELREMRAYRKLGAVRILEEKLERLEQYQRLGTPEEIVEKLRTLDTYKEIESSPEDLRRELSELEAYREIVYLGDFEQLKSVIENLTDV